MKTSKNQIKPKKLSAIKKSKSPKRKTNEMLVYTTTLKLDMFDQVIEVYLLNHKDHNFKINYIKEKFKLQDIKTSWIGATVMMDNGNIAVVDTSWNGKIGHISGTLVHEFTHAAWITMESRGVEFGEWNEPLAYAMGYLYEKVFAKA